MYLYYISKYKSIFRTIGGRRATNVTGWLLQIGAKWWDREVPFWHFLAAFLWYDYCTRAILWYLYPVKNYVKKQYDILGLTLYWYCVLQSGGYYALEWPSRITTLVKRLLQISSDNLLISCCWYRYRYQLLVPSQNWELHTVPSDTVREVLYR